MIEAHGRNKPKSEGAERLSAMQAIAKVETGFSNRKIGLVVTAVMGVVAYFSSFMGQAQVSWEEEGPPEEPDQPTTVAAPFDGRIDRQEAPEADAPARRTAEEGAPAALPSAGQGRGGDAAGPSCRDHPVRAVAAHAVDGQHPWRCGYLWRVFWRGHRRSAGQRGHRRYR